MIQRWVGQLSTTNRSWVMEVFLESIVLFFGQNKYTNTRRFWTIFRHKTRFSSLQKLQKKYSFQYNGYTTYIWKKLKVGHFHCFLKAFKYKCYPKFRTCPNKSIIYRPDIYNLQTRTVTFPDQEKLLEKVDGG